MICKKASFEDIPLVLEIIADAQTYLKNLQIDQWQNNYPNKDSISEDINNQTGYVVTNDRQQIVAYFMFTTTHDVTYNTIDGQWLQPINQPYGVVHRVAIAQKQRGKGIAKFIFAYCHQQLINFKINSLKVDTHKDNAIMQQLLQHLGYAYCGIIFTSYGEPRLAFEKLLSI